VRLILTTVVLAEPLGITPLRSQAGEHQPRRKGTLHSMSMLIIWSTAALGPPPRPPAAKLWIWPSLPHALCNGAGRYPHPRWPDCNTERQRWYRQRQNRTNENTAQVHEIPNPAGHIRI